MAAGRNKVTVVGAGNVGATAAHWIASKELADVATIPSPAPRRSRRTVPAEIGMKR